MVITGELNRKVHFKKPTTTQNDQGGVENTYVAELSSIPAKIKRNNQLRALEAGAIVLINSDTVTIRNSTNRDQITKEWLVTYDSKDHVIHSMDREDEQVKFIVKAKE
jgi:SPP1 family predicted phage head-tail adaptor